MKKFFVLLMLFVCVPFAARAAVIEYKSSDDFVCARSNKDLALDNYQGEVQFTIYFDTGVDSSHSGCDEQYAKIKQQLTYLQADVSEFVLIGSADQQNASGNYDNRALAERRIDYVQKNVLPTGSGWHKYVAGDKNAETYSNNINDQDYRAVNIYIIWRMPSCDSLKDIKDELTVAFATCSNVVLSDELKKCFDGKNLTASEDETLFKFFGEVYTKCVPVKEVSDNSGLTVDIAYNKVNAFVNGLGLSVWRDRDGNFNTARLASDSIAAVVLGTAGGIITSKLVKKNQIKKGFEDLNCSVAGQRIAAWGDEFSVGLQ